MQTRPEAIGYDCAHAAHRYLLLVKAKELLHVRMVVTTLSSFKGRCMDAMVIGRILEFNLPRACVIRGLRFAGP